MCLRLAEVGIPETVQHDDLHDGQVFVRDGGYLFFDWGDSCVSHPFFTMSVTLEGVLSWGLDDVEGSVDVTPFRDAYLASFSEYGSRDGARGRARDRAASRLDLPRGEHATVRPRAPVAGAGGVARPPHGHAPPDVPRREPRLSSTGVLA